MAPTDQEEAWIFRFVLESGTGSPVARQQAEELLDQIIEWVEERGLQIGGGYRAPDPSDAEP